MEECAHEIHVLGVDASSDQIRSVLDASNEIFEIDTSIVPPDPPTDIAEWTSKLLMSHGEIAYCRSESGKVAAFVFVYQRESKPTQLHIWIAGCRPEFRRQGLMARLFQFMEARKASQGVMSLTVNTYPTKFVNMPAFLKSQHYEMYGTAPPSELHPELGEKWSFVKYLQKAAC